MSVRVVGPRVAAAGGRSGPDRAAVVEQLRARLAAVPGTRRGRAPGADVPEPGADPFGDAPDPSPDPADHDRDGRPGDDRGVDPRLADRVLADRAGRRGLAAATVRTASATPVDPSRLLPVPEPLQSLLPEDGLRRGSVVAVLGAGATSLLLALLSRASAGGTWSVVVGVPALSGSAAAEAGVDLARFALVPHPGPDLTAITAALLDGVDLVAVAGTDRLSAPERSRLTARARQRGAVLLSLGAWPGADVVLRCAGSRWVGLAAGGPAASGGRLRQREVLVSATGRRAALPVSARLLLPSGAGRVGRVPAGDAADHAAGLASARLAEARREMAG